MTTEFQKRLKLILNNNFEFSDYERQLISEFWERNVESSVSLRGLNAEEEWVRLRQLLDNQIKIDKSTNSERIGEILMEMEVIYKSGFDPNKERITKIDWEKSFNYSKVIYRTQEEIKKLSKSYKENYSKRYMQRKCLYNGEEIKYGALTQRLRKAGIPVSEAKKYLVKDN